MKALIGIFCLLFVYAAGAGDKIVQQKLTFDQIRIACQNPAKFHNQTAPTNIQVSCADVQYKWMPDVDGSVTMGTSRQVTTSLQSDKYSCDSVVAAVAISPQVVACSRYKLISESVEALKMVTCEEIIAYPGNGIEFCTEVVNDLRAANPAAIVVRDTGKVFSLCEGKQQQGKY